MRTTILLKREKRRKKADDIKAAAVFGIKQAGQAGANAAHGGLKSIERRGLFMVHRAGRRVRRKLSAAKGSVAAAGQAALHKGNAAAAIGGGLMADRVKLAQGSAAGKLKVAQGVAAQKIAVAAAAAKTSANANAHWIGEHSGRNRKSTAAGSLAASALGVAAYRAHALGFPSDVYKDTAFACLVAIAAAALSYLLIARWFANRDTGPVTMAKGAVAIAGAAATSAAKRRVEVPLPALGLGIATLGVLAFWRPPVEWPSLSLTSLTQVANAVSARPVSITGIANAISGDALKIGDVTFQIDGIEAPTNDQSCRKPDFKAWNCATDAKTALANAVRKKQVTCTVTRHTDDGYPIAKCETAGADFAADLVRSGRVFASGGMMALYSAEEAQAKTLRAGIWNGESLRPDEWREARWEDAKRKAPSGCPIKGKVLSRSAKVYMLPWSRRYDQVRVDERRGERWFCSESEAQAAGWKPSGKS